QRRALNPLPIWLVRGVRANQLCYVAGLYCCSLNRAFLCCWSDQRIRSNRCFCYITYHVSIGVFITICQHLNRYNA
uniref:Uncharacterized protein n=1 Tax=Ciona intestinalis TaxID=7719 RepID=H2XZQ6_CIOIN